MAKPTRKCTKCGTHAVIGGSSNKPDIYGNRVFICAACVKKDEKTNQKVTKN